MRRSTKAPKIFPPSKVDRGRKRIPLLTAVAFIFTTSCLALAYNIHDYTAFLAFIYITTLVAVFFASYLHFMTIIASGRRCWRKQQKNVVLIAPTSLLLWNFCTLIFAAGSPLVSILIRFLIGPYDSWRIPSALGAIGATALPLLTPAIRAGGPTRNRITLTREGIELTQIDKHTRTIPWKAHPYLAGIQKNKAIIKFKKRQEIRYPIGYLPMSMRQLERLLTTFSTNKQLRTSLSGPDALSTVLTILEPTDEELTDGSWTWKHQDAPTTSRRSS